MAGSAGKRLMAKLYFYYASMNAGKSTTLLQADFNYRERGMATMLWTAALDDRAGERRIDSRIGLATDANQFAADTDMWAAITAAHAAQPLAGQVGRHLVHVHVAADAASAVIRIHDKMLVMQPGSNLGANLPDRRGDGRRRLRAGPAPGGAGPARRRAHGPLRERAVPRRDDAAWRVRLSAPRAGAHGP